MCIALIPNDSLSFDNGMPTDSEAAPTTANHQDLNQFLLNGAHVLCSQEEWLWDGWDNNRLIFYADGTGEVSEKCCLDTY